MLLALKMEEGTRIRGKGQEMNSPLGLQEDGCPAYPSQTSNLLTVREYIHVASSQYMCGNLLREQRELIQY